MVIQKTCPKHMRPCKQNSKSAIVVNEEKTRKVLAEPNISTKEYIYPVYQSKVHKVHIYCIYVIIIYMFIYIYIHIYNIIYIYIYIYMCVYIYISELYIPYTKFPSLLY